MPVVQKLVRLDGRLNEASLNQHLAQGWRLIQAVPYGGEISVVLAFVEKDLSEDEADSFRRHAEEVYKEVSKDATTVSAT